MKKAAYMLDTTAWNSKFKDVKNKAEYAIGGPTIEMIMKSYSQKYKVDYQARAKDVSGYETSLDGGKSWKADRGIGLNANDSLYVINATSDAKAMWVASPSATLDVGFTHLILIVSNLGGITYNDSKFPNECRGFRPLICLKPNVELKQNGDGTYTIK